MVQPTDPALSITLRQSDIPTDPALPALSKRSVSRPNSYEYPYLSSPVQKGIHIFISYARRDQSLRAQLEDHLSHLKYRGLITTWTANEISAGEEVIQQIDIHLNAAHIILLLISASFLASRYCYSREMMRAIQRHVRGDADVIPVLLRPAVFTGAPFAELRPLPTNGKPVVNWRNRDSAFVDIALGIERVVQKHLALLPPTLGDAPGYAPPPFPGSYAPPPFREPPAPPPFPGSYAPPSVSTSPLTRHGAAPPYYLLRISRPILVGLSLLGILFIASLAVLLAKYPALALFLGVVVGSLVLLVGILLALRAFVKRVQSRAAQKRREGEARHRALEEAQRRGQEEANRQEREEIRRRTQERTYYEEALAAYERALRQDNADATAYRGKGSALVGLERYDEALVAFTQAVALLPLPLTYVHMGDALATLRRYEEAVADYLQALALDASYASAYAGMSEAFRQLGRVQEAEQAHEQAKQLDGDD